MSGPRKHATRWKMEVVDADERQVWQVLASTKPPLSVMLALDMAGFTLRRATHPDRSGELPLVYSHSDPWASVEAAREHALRRETQLANALLLLINHVGQWVGRDEIRRVAGDQGDRRVRELRARNWPIEIHQIGDRQPWHVRLVLPEQGQRYAESA